MPYATALAGACPWLSIDGNLLPAEQRRGSSRVRLIPTFALGTILFVMLGALGAQSRWADSRYLGVLQHEIRRFEPQARKVDALDRAVTVTRANSQMLDEYRRRAQHDMEALTEITKLIPPPGWVGSLDMDRQLVQIAGEADQAAGLLKTLDESRLFERSEFTMPITRTPSGDAFRLKAVRTPSGAAVLAESQPANQPAPSQGMPAQTGFVSPQPIVPPGFQQAAPPANIPALPSRGGSR
jgi:hypothetical protein